ncbi:peptide deformylase [Candidatus Parcubacteria bacterium]|nr:peptide deformylase [Candidatus Parcubacteria bacterium]
MPMIVLTSPNPNLRQPSQAVSDTEIVSPEMKKLVDVLKETMAVENGVGIAAPQVGIGKRVIIVDTGAGPQAFFNPVITRRSLQKIESEEGCLSVPEVFGIVRRHRAVTVKAVDESGKPVTIRARQFPAIVFQHEIDHLDGILFIDKVVRFTKPERM